MNRGNNATAGTIFAVLLFINATGTAPTEPPRTRPALYTKYETNAALTKQDKTRVAKHCVAGLPKRRDGALHGPTRYVFRDAYVLENSLELRMPLWVCEKLTKADVEGDAPRSKKSFAVDPELARYPHARQRDFKTKGFAQGHLAPDANRQDETLKDETFFLSNIVPQVGANFNGAIWSNLEKRVRKWAAARGECWVITGAFIHDPAEENEQTADGLVDYVAVGKSPVCVPTHMFKIVIAKDADGAWDALAFVFENRKYEKGESPQNYLSSIEWIEERTGLDYLPRPPQGFDAAALRGRQATALWTDGD